ncbi:hypothetical protein NQ318_019387 [Aromia moschata]|uniref:Uncharacterized protein n=1 Tax=Aromia moschata TaxID=1265417 RepID=A0AAV8X0F1_9CUCU|nr:hypothetical protein NQ318_019387 [Aromia moschata]
MDIEPNFIKKFSEHGQIIRVHFSPFERSQDLILIGFEKKILLAHLEIDDYVAMKVLMEFVHPCRCTTLSFSLPVHNNMIFPENGGDIKFSRQGELVAAVNSLDGSLKIVHVKSQAIKLTGSVTLPTNVCWHYRCPIVCVGDDNKLCFWQVSAK